MARKATQEKLAQPGRRARPRQQGSQAIGGEAAATQAPPGVDGLNLNAALLEAQKRVFSDEREAIEFFVAHLIGAVQEPGEQGQMREFLELLLETDPQLKQDLLAGVTSRK